MKIIQTDLLTPATLPASETEKLWIYGGLDACVTHEILPIIKSQLDPVTKATYEFELELMAPILEMNMRGVLIDELYRRKLIVEYQDDLDKLEDNLNRILNDGLGINLNWRSNPALLDLFYNKLALPPVKKRNSKGEFTPTVNRDALERLEDYLYAQPIVAHLLTLRDLGKKISFLKTGIDADTRIRTSYNIGGTTTGRLSSSFNDFGTGTNLQNIEPRLRRIFITDNGYKFCNIDLEQSDSRGIGAICWNLFHDGVYLDACESGDLHSTVSKMVWPRIDPRSIFYRTFTHRDTSKRLGHATNFYGQPQEIAKQVKIPISLVKDFQPAYLARFSCIPRWWESRRTTLLADGFLTSLLGRRRWFFGRRNDPQVFKKMIAFEPQSITADTINRGLLKVWKANRVQCLLQVHDSILVQYKEEEEQEIVPWLKQQIEQEVELKHGRRFTIPAEAQVGWNWAYVSDDNPDGLIKWTGSDARTRSSRPTTSLLDHGLLRIHRELPIPTLVEEVGGDISNSG
jgi:DNA polymerase-1